MYKRLLVADDGSASSAAALDDAVDLCKTVGGEVQVVYVVQYPTSFGDPMINLSALDDALRAEGQTIVDASAQRARAAGVTVSAEVVAAGRRSVAAALIAEADAWNADLIVMGTHGRRGLDHLILGSVAEKLARTARKPVLLVRASSR